jgi:hypothetical protein
MIEIKNKTRSPVQLLVRSRTAPREFTTLNIPGVGAGKNTYLLEDERSTEYIERAEKKGLISTRHLLKKELNKGE